MCIQLAIATGIAPSVWADEGEQAIITAIGEIEEQNRRLKGKAGSSG